MILRPIRTRTPFIPPAVDDEQPPIKNNVNNTEVSETTSDTNSQSDKTIETTGTDGN